MIFIPILNLSTIYVTLFIILLAVPFGRVTCSSRHDIDSGLAENKHLVIDAFPFNGEPMSFRRLQYLEDVVDLFVIIEASYTHSGIKKNNLALNDHSHMHTEVLNSLEKKGKLIKLIIDRFPFDDNTTLARQDTELFFQREIYQRDIVAEFLLDRFSNQSFILIACDADEIPRRDVVASLPSLYNNLSQGIHFEMMFFYYTFKWQRSENWKKGFAVNDLFLRNKIFSLSVYRTLKEEQFKILPNAGWHCSYCMPPKKVLAKIKSFTHASEFPEEMKTMDWVNHCIKHGVDILNRTYAWDQLTLYDGSNGLPTCKQCEPLLI